MRFRFAAVAMTCAVVLLGQAQTPFKVGQNSATGSGEIWQQEARANGTNWLKHKPAAMAADYSIQYPSAVGTSGYCLTEGGSGTTTVLTWAACGDTERLVSDYDWSKSVGTVSAGTLTVTFTERCPADGSDTTYKFLVTGTGPSSEVVTSDGAGTCTVGSSGTITGTLAGGHTSATAQSASDGWQEAFYSVADSGVVRLRAAVGTYNIYSDILTGARSVTVQCDGPGALLVPQANDIAIFNAAAPTGIRIAGCAINNTASKTGVTGIKTYNPTGDSFGTAIRDVQIEGVATCVHLGTVYAISDFSHNRLFQCSSKALWLEQVNTGDAGTGLIGPNNLFSDSLGAQYGILWNGPGNVKIQGNSFNGYVEQIHMEPTMGTVNVSGTAVTWVSGHKFRAGMAGFGLAASSTVFATISSVTDDENIVLATSQPTCTGCSYYVGITGQMQIVNNTMDGGSATTHNIRLSGAIPFFNFQIDGNFATAYTVSNNKSITVDGAGYRFGSIKHNNLQTSTVGTTIGVDVSAGGSIDVHDNQIVNQKTGVAIGASAVTVTSDGNRCTDTTNTTDCLTSASATTLARELNSVTHTQLTALSVANGSTLYCSNCKASATGCAASGTGAQATRTNGAWQCEETGYQPWTVSGSDIYFSTGNVGIGTTSPIVKLHVKGTAGAANLLIEDQTGNGVLNVFSENGYSFAGTGTATDFLLGSDNASRWRITSTGMLRPELDNTYDFGLTGTRPRVVYGHGGDFSPSGTGGYLRARKFEMTDRLGGAGFWDASAGANAAGASDLKIRDNAGSRALLLERAVGGVASNRLFAFGDWLPAQRATADGDAVNDSVNPSLGGTSDRWEKVWANDADFADDVAVGDVLTVTGVSTLTGNVNFLANIVPGFDGLGSVGTGSVRVGNFYGYDADFADDVVISGSFTLSASATAGYVWTATDSSGIGSWQPAGSTALPVADTTAVVKGSVDATKLARFEVDGFSTGTTRVFTLPNADSTLAGLGNSNTWTGTNTFQGQFVVTGGIASHLIPAANNTYDLGEVGTPNRWREIHAVDGSFLGDVTASSFTGPLIGSANPATNNTGTVGTSSLRYATYYGYDADFADDVTITGDLLLNAGVTNFSGDLIPKTSNVSFIGDSTHLIASGWFNTVNATNMSYSGNSGQTVTITVRDAAGTGTCTIVFTAGGKTGGTC